MRDPYQVLGVPKSADEKEIKSAFRKLAKKYHPDQYKDDASAKASFGVVSNAYEIIGVKKKRAQFAAGFPVLRTFCPRCSVVWRRKPVRWAKWRNGRRAWRHGSWPTSGSTQGRRP